MRSLRRHVAISSSQRGAALLMLTVILAIGTIWAIVSALNAARNNTAAKQTSNAAVLQQAKSALLGYLAIKASDSSNAFPGILPCPEVPNPTPATEGMTAGFCTLPAVGRLPWRTLGMDKLTDSAGEPLWYVLSPGFNRASSGVALKINSNTPAQLTLDGTANAAIALIIAPGSALKVQAAAGCTARSQVRSQTFPLDYRDYLECDNATSPADNSFVSTGPSESFNDQVLAVTHADVFNIVEAAVAKRIETDIVPEFKLTNNGVYNSPDWSATPSAPRFPFAAPFPSSSTTSCLTPPCTPDTHYYAGAAGTSQGLLPVSYSKQADTVTNCVVGASDPRCNPSLVTWKTGPGFIFAATLPIQNAARYSMYSTPTFGPTMTVPNGYISITEVANIEFTRSTLAKLDCSATTSTLLSCAITYGRSCSGCSAAYTVRPRIRLTARAQNVAKAFKTFDDTQVTALDNLYPEFKTGALALFGASPLGVLRSDGDADITTEWLLPSKSCTVSLCNTYTIRIPIALITDHAIVSPASWFIANEWYKLTYYAVSTANTPGGGSGTCDGTHPCLTVNTASGSNSPNAILILAGRNIGAGSRPSSTLASYLEGANADGADLIFDKTAPPALLSSKSLFSTFNDRVITLYP